MRLLNGEQMDRPRYVLRRLIASGGMAQVYEVEAIDGAGRTTRVALKRILPEYAGDAGFRRMFLDEARIASLLNHPNIARLLDFGFVEGAEFLVLELVEGLDAGRAFRRIRVEHPAQAEQLAIHVGARVAAALRHAHEEVLVAGVVTPVVHRDVSPANLLLGVDGSVKLTDFGIALAEVRAERTRTGVVKGKEDYMAPEQAAGARVGPAADIYSLAVTIHALAKGWPAREVSDLSPSCSKALYELLGSCLAADPGIRPSARALHDRLGAMEEAHAVRELAVWIREQKDAEPGATAFDRAIAMQLVPDGSTRDYTVASAPATAPRKPATRGMARAALVAAALFVALGTVWGTVLSSAPSDAAKRAAEEAQSIPPGGADPLASASDGAEVVARSPSEEGPIEAPPGDVVDRNEPASPVVRTRRDPVAAPNPEVPEAATEDTDPSGVGVSGLGTGWIQIGGAAWLGMRVEVDGRPAGHVPLFAEVPVGSHSVVIRSTSEEAQTWTRDLLVRPENRRSSPVRWIADER